MTELHSNQTVISDILNENWILSKLYCKCYCLKCLKKYLDYLQALVTERRNN